MSDYQMRYIYIYKIQYIISNNPMNTGPTNDPRSSLFIGRRIAFRISFYLVLKRPMIKIEVNKPLMACCHTYI